jgi:hypothetical protein
MANDYGATVGMNEARQYGGNMTGTCDEGLGVKEAREPDDGRQQAGHRPVKEQVAALDDVVEPASQGAYRRVRDLMSILHANVYSSVIKPKPLSSMRTARCGPRGSERAGRWERRGVLTLAHWTGTRSWQKASIKPSK